MGNNLTAQQIDQSIHQIRQDLHRETKKFQATLPDHIKPERFLRVIVTAITNNTDLLMVPADLLLLECTKAATDGLLPDGREGALVPRGNARKGNISCSWQPMIAGIRKKARNSGEISSWDAHAAYRNDKFHVRLGDDPKIEHEIDFTKDDRGDVMAFYSVAIMKDGTKSFDVMTVSDVTKIRDRSDAFKAFKNGYIKSTPWDTDFDQMGIKTVAKRHSKQLPMSTDLDRLMHRDDEIYKSTISADSVSNQIEGKTQASLEHRLNDLGGEDGDDEAGETIDNETGEVTTNSEIDKARERGAKDKADGKAKRSMPKAYRENEELRSAYVEGFDGKQDEGGDGFPGDR